MLCFSFFYGPGLYCCYDASVVSLTCTSCSLRGIVQQVFVVQCSFVQSSMLLAFSFIIPCSLFDILQVRVVQCFLFKVQCCWLRHSSFLVPCSIFSSLGACLHAPTYPGLNSRPKNRTIKVVRRNRRCHEMPPSATKNIASFRIL